MAGKSSGGRIKAPGKKIRRYREGIPKTIAEVAAAGVLDERTVLNIEKSHYVGLRTLSKLAKGLGVPYKNLLALARKEIKTLDDPAQIPASLNSDTEFKSVRITLELPFELATKPGGKVEALLTLLKEWFKDGGPDGPSVTPGSTHVTIPLRDLDILRLHRYWLEGRLDDFPISAIQMVGSDHGTRALSIQLDAQRRALELLVSLSKVAAHASRSLRGIAKSSEDSDVRSLESELRDGIEQLKLSPMEAQVTALLVSGLTNKQIAKAIGKSSLTVATYIARIFARTGVSSRAELLARIVAR